MNLNLTVGKVPGTVKQITINTPASVLTAMQTAAGVCGFSFSSAPYSANGKEMIDVPFLNGRELAVREGENIVQVLWDTEVTDGDIILLVPKIRGNQFLVTVAKVPGQRHTVALLHANEPEAEDCEGTVLNAIQVAGLEFDPDIEEVLVNGELSDTDTVLNDGDEVVITEKVSVNASELLDPDDDDQPEQIVKKYFTVFKSGTFKIRVARDYTRILIILK
jgi:molybdopterin converting factor small subunit